MSCASKLASASKQAATSLRLNRCRRASNADYLRARVLQAHLSGNQTDDGTRENHPIADPGPTDERKDVELKDRLGIARRNALESDIEVFVQATADADKRGLLLARFVDAD